MTTRLLLAEHREYARDYGHGPRDDVKPDNPEKQRRNRGHLDPGHDDYPTGHGFSTSQAVHKTRHRPISRWDRPKVHSRFAECSQETGDARQHEFAPRVGIAVIESGQREEGHLGYVSAASLDLWVDGIDL